MRKHARYLSFLLALPCLFSCSGKTYIDSYGEVSEEATTYPEALEEEKGSSLLSRVELGETVYLLHASYSCGVCQRLEPVMVEALKKTNLRLSLFYKRSSGNDDYNESVSLLEKGFPANSDNTDGFITGCPRLFKISKGSCKALDFMGASDSAGSLSAYLSRLGSKNGLTHFLSSAKASSFASGHGCPVYLYSSEDSDALSFYYDAIRKHGERSAKPFAILDYEAMDENEKEAALSYFSLSSYAPVLKSGSTALDVKSEADKAASLVASYY